ncbi:hypothetical protein BDZ45DRAFT_541413, partial [Acephala macrosclerotiorum]
MPGAFQDAVTVTRALGIQYLWIDSLCIVQDDAQDWQIESSKMAEIFSNAHLTIIAATGSSCNDGFLRRISEILGSKWIIRGWTFQEERLARRALVFGENKLFFNCRTLERSEDTEMSVPLDLTDTADPGHWDNWQTLCTHYAFRELTFPEDKLLAISGIASKTGKKCESQYLAGLWKTNIVHDLFRKTVGVATKPKNYRAPSWSWASLDGRITRPSWEHDSVSEDCSMRCTILDVQTTPSGLDPYGAVEDGLLKIEGAL